MQKSPPELNLSHKSVPLFERYINNPILSPEPSYIFESEGAFNPCVIKNKGLFHAVYRAMSPPQHIGDANLSVSTIAYAQSKDGKKFYNKKCLIAPEYAWETYGCEDPRITYINEKYYIFYTALSGYPFDANHIKVGLAISKDLKTIDSKHLITPFNAKAMTLFPEKINGKYAALLTVHTDIPPSKIALALFDKEEDIWSLSYWNAFYASLDDHILPLLRSSYDHLEIGAPPIKTSQGWLLAYSYIQNYFSGDKIFGIEVFLLDLDDPSKIIGNTNSPLLTPKEYYELDGFVPNVIFPSGALVHADALYLYYGGADTCGNLAIAPLPLILEQLCDNTQDAFTPSSMREFQRYNKNPILKPRPEFSFEAKATYNPGAIYLGGYVHLIYRAESYANTSSLGYAKSLDGVHIVYRARTPILSPNEWFERKLKPGNSGIEDPRLTVLEDKLYIFYVAYDGYIPRVAYTSIKVSDFLNQWWNFEKPRVISSPNMVDKNACLLPKKINNQYVIFHRIQNDIYIDYVDSLDDECVLKNKLVLIHPDLEKHCIRVGISAPPIETPKGWILLYHWIYLKDEIKQYQVGAALLALNQPEIVLKKNVLLFKPEMPYEQEGLTPHVVFPCGAVCIRDEIYVYYGAADNWVAMGKISLQEVIERLLSD